MRPLLILAAFGLAQPASAEGWAMKPGDEVFTPDGIAAFVAGTEIRFYDGGRSEYGADGSYAYVYDGGDRAEGRYRIEDDGSVCVEFLNGWSRCDLYVRNGGRVLLIDEKGDRYPLKPTG
ncbi:hypothetical protein OEZ60_03120 [Defluviimonas sp. WL0024]|uniref:MORN repeat variant n=1 Tax=Albidovulum salinarum TaxID=2984153 RepID=A0ABT2X580_9RHOB|nr:hypothetical protein [Defluviimonas sp. WL0024]MCU9846985.1 hypothetical protein [Defluviimonas sp. WL0024]